MKVFQNRITHEDMNTINKLYHTMIEINNHQPFNHQQEDYWFITINPNTYVDSIQLERDLTHNINRYYRWRYDSKWTKIKDKIQLCYTGVLEKQHGNYHIHLILHEDNVSEFTLFCGYIKELFKDKYPKTSTQFERIYNLTGCINYIHPNNKTKHRTDDTILILNNSITSFN